MAEFDKYDAGAYHWEATHDAFIQGYSPKLEARYSLPRQEILARIESDAPRVLDIGCGDGAFLHYLFQGRIDGIGTDMSRQGLELYEEKAGDRSLPVVTADASKVPFATGFDAVTLIDVIEHLPDPEAVLKEIYRVLVPGGLCLITTPIGREGDPSSYHVQEFSESQLRTLLSSTFDEVEIYGYTPDRIYTLYQCSFAMRQLIRLSSKAGRNPFMHRERNPNESAYRFFFAIAKRSPSPAEN